MLCFFLSNCKSGKGVNSTVPINLVGEGLKEAISKPNGEGSRNSFTIFETTKD